MQFGHHFGGGGRMGGTKTGGGLLPVEEPGIRRSEGEVLLVALRGTHRCPTFSSRNSIGTFQCSCFARSQSGRLLEGVQQWKVQIEGGRCTQRVCKMTRKLICSTNAEGHYFIG